MLGDSFYRITHKFWNNLYCNALKFTVLRPTLGLGSARRVFLEHGIYELWFKIEDTGNKDLAAKERRKFCSRAFFTISDALKPALNPGTGWALSYLPKILG